MKVRSIGRALATALPLAGNQPASQAAERGQSGQLFNSDQPTRVAAVAAAAALFGALELVVVLAATWAVWSPGVPTVA